jgi:hypothetical protein
MRAAEEAREAAVNTRTGSTRHNVRRKTSSSSLRRSSIARRETRGHTIPPLISHKGKPPRYQSAEKLEAIFLHPGEFSYSKILDEFPAAAIEVYFLYIVQGVRSLRYGKSAPLCACYFCLSPLIDLADMYGSLLYIPEREGLPYFFRSSALHPDHSEKRLRFYRAQKSSFQQADPEKSGLI